MRNLSPGFRSVLESRRRRPAYRLYAWDPGTTTISAVSSAPDSNHSSIPEPLDLTPYASDLDWSDKKLSFTIVDPGGLFHPDTGANQGYLRDGAILRLVEGDETLEEDDWLTTFTGQVHGQVGWRKSRRTGQVTARVTVFGRGENQAYKRRKITTREYTAGTDLGVALHDVAETFMGLTHAEILIPQVLGRVFMHKTNQLSQVSPWEGVEALLQVVCCLPLFNGEGRLTCLDKNLQRPPMKVLEDYAQFFELEVPERSQDGVNKVKVTFLDSQMERVDGPYQCLGTAQVTTGFFSLGEELDAWWSEDHKQRADGTSLKVVKSVNSGVLPVGEESYEEVDEFHGRITVTIHVWVPILATAMLAEYLAAAFIPDDVVVGIGTGFTIPVGRVVQAQAMIGILLIMMSIGSAQYEVWGTPYDYAYLEKQSVAIEDGLEYWQENEKEIKNDFIGTHDQADKVAVTELVWEKTQNAPRRLALEDDPSLEPGDILVLPDGRRIVIMALSKKIKRGEVPVLVIDGCKVVAA